MAVYIAMRADGAVKIGASSDVAARLVSLRSTHKTAFTLLRTVDGSYCEEAWMHRKFKDQCLGGEFFVFSADMMTVSIPSKVDILREVPEKRNIQVMFYGQDLDEARCWASTLGLSVKDFILSAGLTAARNKAELK